MDKSRLRFKAKVVNNNPMTNQKDGWVYGFYFQDLYEGKIKHFIRSDENIWEVIPESVSHGTNLFVPDANGKNVQVFEGDIVAIHDSQNNYWYEYVIGWDNKGFQLGICPVLYYFCDRPGAKDGFVGRELRASLCRKYVCRLLLHAYDLAQRYKVSYTHENDPFIIAHEQAKLITIPERWEPVIKLN